MKYADAVAAAGAPIDINRTPWKIAKIAVMAAIASFTSFARASVLDWSGNEGNTWDTSLLNWNGGVAAWSNNSPLETAHFSADAAKIAVSGFIEVAAIQFDTPNWTLGSSINNGSFSMDGAGGAIAISVNGTDTINSSFLNDGSPVGITVSGSGTLILGGTNSSYTGNTTVNSGATVQFATDVGTTTSVFGGTSGGQGTIHLNGGTLAAAAVSATLKHNIVLDADGTLNTTNAGTLTFTGSISGAGRLIKSGTPDLTISSTDALTFQGGLTVNNGSLNIAGGTGNNFTGGVIINAGGTLAFTNTMSQINAAAPQSLTLNGGTLALTAANSVNPTWASLTLAAGGANISAVNFSSTSKTMQLGAITRAAGGTINFGALPTTGSLLTTTANANFAGGQQTILGGYAVANVDSKSAQWTWAVSGTGATAGKLTPLAAIGYTAFSAGDISAGASKDVDLTSNSPTYLSPNAMTINSLRFSSPATSGTSTLTLANPLAIATGGILLSSTNGSPTAGQMGAVRITGSTLTSGNGADLVILDTSSTSKTTTIDSVITGDIGLTYNVLVDHTNTLALTAANDFTGDTNISGGTLLIANPLALQNSTLNLKLATTSALAPQATLAFAAGITSATLGNLSGDANIDLDSASPIAAVSLTVGGNNQDVAYSGALGSTGGSLTKVGRGTLRLSGVNTFTGGAEITAGTLVAASSHALGAGDVIINGGTLEIDPAVDIGSGSLTLTSGTLRFDLGADPAAAMTGSGNYKLVDGATIDLGLGGADSAFYDSTYELLTFTSGAMGKIALVDYDTADFTALLSDNGRGAVTLSFSRGPSPDPVPEPGSLALLGLAAAFLVSQRRRWVG